MKGERHDTLQDLPVADKNIGLGFGTRLSRALRPLCGSKGRIELVDWGIIHSNDIGAYY